MGIVNPSSGGGFSGDDLVVQGPSNASILVSTADYVPGSNSNVHYTFSPEVYDATSGYGEAGYELANANGDGNRETLSFDVGSSWNTITHMLRGFLGGGSNAGATVRTVIDSATGAISVSSQTTLEKGSLTPNTSITKSYTADSMTMNFTLANQLAINGLDFTGAEVADMTGSLAPVAGLTVQKWLKVRIGTKDGYLPWLSTP